MICPLRSTNDKTVMCTSTCALHTTNYGCAILANAKVNHELKEEVKHLKTQVQHLTSAVQHK